jgi:dienelactone hydrolase
MVVPWHFCEIFLAQKRWNWPIKDGMNSSSLILAFMLSVVASVQGAVLPGTKPLEMDGDLSARMVAGIDRFLTARTETSVQSRATHWNRDFSSPEAYEKSIEKNRARLRHIIGANEERVMFKALDFVSSSIHPNLVAETGHFTARSARWPVFADVEGEGLWLKPKQPNGICVIAVPDADQTPEMLCGLAMGTALEAQFARRLAEAGCEVFIPTLLSRSDTLSGNAELNRFTNQPHREWIYRQAYELGGHVIGYEVQKILALVDWLERRGEKKIAVAGWGEGGLLALHAGALDRRIGATLVSGHFGPRENLWREPIYRNVFGLLREFGDAELASLIAPRALVVEYSASPEIQGPPPPRSGRGGAAPGELSTPERAEVEEEFERARSLLPEAFTSKFNFAYGPEGSLLLPGSDKTLRFLGDSLGVKITLRQNTPALSDARTSFDAGQREKRQFDQLVNHTQANLVRSERVRDERFWKKTAKLSAAEWEMKKEPFLQQFWEEVIGKLPSPDAAMNPRSRLVLDEPNWRGYEVVLDVWPDVFAWGILLVPKNLAAGEKRPVVVCQHGLEGVPRDTIDGPENRGYQAYHSFAARLADRGFITFAPHNPYRGRDKFRVLQRKANPLGQSLFSVILGQHEQILNWLGTLPFVDAGRIGFYGLSYGGKTAMRVPALLDRYVLSICSADFNEWVKKNATVHSPYSYMFTGEYEMPEFDLGRTFNYAEMAALIAPRPFMVERGHDDGVAPDEWVAYEFAKVKRFYDKLGVGDRTELEVFDGPHTIHGVGTFEFLHRHLNWPEP